MNFQYLEQYLDYLTHERRYPGVDCIVTVKGETVYRYGKGYADVESGTPIAPDQLYNIYSASKVITCVAAMQLVEQGKIALDQKLYEIFPEFKNMTVRQMGSVRPAKTYITIGDLFAMTAGFNYDCQSPAVVRTKAKTGGRTPLLEYVRELAKEPLDFDPGTRFQYSLCHDVLGAVIEQVSGMSFGAYLKKHIFDPLGMVDTGFCRDESIMNRVATLYQREVDEAGKEIIYPVDKNHIYYVMGSEYESGGAGIITSVNDYIKLMIAICAGGKAPDGTRILSRFSVDLMRMNRLHGQQMIDYNHPGQGYGLGMRVTMNSAEAEDMAPDQEFGWGGAAGARVMMDPVNQVCIYYAQHMLNSNADEVHPRLCNLIYSALEL